MSTEENKMVAQRLNEESWNSDNLDVLDELCDPSYRLEGVGGVAEQKQAIMEYRRGFPDLHLTIEDIIAEGDKVAIRWTFRGTHLGEFDGIAPTGKQVTGAGMSFYHLANGKIVSDWFESSSPGPRDQLLGS